MEVSVPAWVLGASEDNVTNYYNAITVMYSQV